MTPDGWVLAGLGELCQGKGAYGANVPKSPFRPEWPRYVRITDITDDGRLRGDDPASISIDAAAPHLLEPGDILLARSGATVGKAYVHEARYGLCAHAGYLIRFRARRDVLLPEYLRYVLQSREYWNWVRTTQRAQAQPNINAEEYARMRVLLPPLREQRKIAAILSAVDDAIEATQAIIDQLQVLKKAMTTELLTRGLPRRDTQFKQTAIGEVPADWDVVTMEELALPRGMVGGPFGSDLTAKDYVPTGIPVIRGSNVSMGCFREDEFVCVSSQKAQALSKNSARPGDIVMTQRGASLGEATLIPNTARADFYIISQTMMRMTPDSAKVEPRFLLHFTCSPLAQGWLQKHQIATGQPHLNLGIYRAMPALVPSRVDQEAIAELLDAIDSAGSANRLVLETRTQLKAALMALLLSGELRVTSDAEVTT